MGFDLRKFLDDKARAASIVAPKNQPIFSKPAAPQKQVAKLPTQFSASNKPAPAAQNQTPLITSLRQRDNRFNSVDEGLTANKSWEQISQDTGVNLDRVRAYSKATRPEYGIKKPQVTPLGSVKNAANEAGQTLKAGFFAPGGVGNSAIKFNEGVGTNVQGIVHAAPRAVKSLGLDARNKPEWKPSNILEEGIYGKTPIKNSQQVGKTLLNDTGAFVGDPTYGDRQSTLKQRIYGTASNLLDTSGIAVPLKKGIEKAAPQIVRAADPLIKSGTKEVVNAVDQAGIPKARTDLRVPLEDRRILTDYSDMQMGHWNPDAKTRNELTAKAWAIGDRIGLDVRNDSRAGVQRKVADYLDELNYARSVTKQGGYAKLPFKEKGEADISPTALDYAHGTSRPDDIVKESSDYWYKHGKETKGGQLLNTGDDQYRRISEHNQFYSDFMKQNKRAPSKADYQAEVTKQLENGGGSMVEPDQATAYQIVKQRISDQQVMGQGFGSSQTSQPGTRKQAPNNPAFEETSVQKTETGNSPRPLVGEARRLKESDSQVLQADRSLPNNTPELPIQNTKKVKAIDKAFRSTRSIIERQGESGRQLANDLHASRDTQELFLADLQKKMPNVTKLARRGNNALINRDFENFVDATQGLAKPRNERVAKAVQEWRGTHPQIRDRAVAAGLDVGDLGANYYPHFIDYDQVFKDRNTYNQAINHLVKTGQAKSPEEAIKLLGYARDVSRNREFGNLEASRLVDLPFYDKSSNSFTNYLNSSSRRIAQAETFGKKDEKALKLISKIGLEGGDTEAAKSAFDIASGARQYGETPEKISRNIRKYITTTRLGLGALTNTSQSVNTGIVTGHFRTMGAMFKQLNPKNREFVADTGVIADAVLNDLRTQKGIESFTSKVFGKVVNKITAPGFGAVEKFNRSVAATAGRDYALRLAQSGKPKHQKILREKLGVTGEIKNGTLNEAQQIQAARSIVEKTQFKVDAQDLPGWTDSPGGKLVSQFRTFSYNQAKFFSNEVLKPAAKLNFMPLARVLAALPLGYALYETRRNIDGRPEEEDLTKVATQSFGKIGGAGLVLDIYNGINPAGSKYIPTDRRVSMAVGTVGGPAIGQATQLIGGLSEAVQKKNIPENNPDLENKVGIRSGQGDEEGYNDLTSLTRLGIQQVPIVGTPIANRVLPYKKKEEGKPSGTVANAATPFDFLFKSPDANKPKDTRIQDFKDQKEERSKALKNTMSEDDYDLYQMGKEDRQKLVEQGVVTKEKLEGLDWYANREKGKLGMEVTQSSVDKLPDTLKSRKDIQNIYRELDNMSAEDAKAWRKGEANGNSQDLIKQANTMLPKEFPGLPSNNGVAESYVEYLKKSEEGKWSELQKQKEMGEFVKNAYEAQFNDDEKFIRDLPDADLLDAVDNGLVEKSVLDKIIAMDDILIELGMDAKVGKKARAALGYHDQPTTVRGTGKSTKAASRAKGKGRKFAIPSDSSMKTANSTYADLQKLLAGTTAKASKPNQIGRKVALKKITVKGTA